MRKYFFKFTFSVLAIFVITINQLHAEMSSSGGKKSFFSLMDEKLSLVDNKLPKLIYKTLEFKTGIGMDFGSNGVALGLSANVYNNFTPGIAAFTGVDYRYNVYQIPNKPTDSVFTPESRTKMDLLFKIGGRFKVHKDISLSPYVILGMGYGSIKQETQYYSSSETTHNSIIENYQTLKSIKTVSKITNKYDVDDATGALENIDYESHRQFLPTGYGIRYKVDDNDSRQVDVYEVKNYIDAKEILDNGVNHYQNNITYIVPNSDTTVNSSVNFGFLPIVSFNTNSSSLDNFGFSVMEDSKSANPQYGYQGSNGTDNVSGLNSIFNGNDRFFAFKDNVEDSEYVAKNAKIYNVATFLNDGSIAVIRQQFGELADAVNVNVDVNSVRQSINNDFQLSSINGLTESQEIIAATDPIVYDQKLTILKATNLSNGENVYFYYPQNGDKVVSLEEAKQQINDFSKASFVDKRTELQASKVQENKEEKNETTKIGNVEYSYTENSNMVKVDTSVDQKQKCFFKGGLGLELTFKNRFFMRLEYKYSALGATNTMVYNVNSYRRTTGQVYNTDYTQTNTTYTNNIYKNRYEANSVNNNVLTNYNIGAVDGVVDGKINVVEVKNGGLDTSKSTTSPMEVTYDYAHKTIDNDRSFDVVELVGTTTKTEMKKTTFHMHEISFGFGFYFL